MRRPTSVVAMTLQRGARPRSCLSHPIDGMLGCYPNTRSWRKPAMAFYELRQYKVRPGMRYGWIKIMEEEIIPFQVSKGMVICGSFRGETDPSVYIWLRRFESEAQREALYVAVYETEHWKTQIAPRVP